MLQGASHLLHAAGALSRQKGRASGQSRDVCVPACRWAAHAAERGPVTPPTSPSKTPRGTTSAGAAYSPVSGGLSRAASVPCGRTRRTGRRAKRALRGPRHRRGPVARRSRAQPGQEEGGQLGWHQTGLRRVFEQERRPFMSSPSKRSCVIRRPPALKMIGATEPGGARGRSRESAMRWPKRGRLCARVGKTVSRV